MNRKMMINLIHSPFFTLKYEETPPQISHAAFCDVVMDKIHFLNPYFLICIPFGYMIHRTYKKKDRYIFERLNISRYTKAQM